jgi:predicted nucleic-acid-binding protein
MIGLDTNILIRLVVEDDARQTLQAKRFVASRCTSDSPGFVNSIVLAEMVWVLRRHGYGRREVAAAIERLLSGRDRLLEHHNEVAAALADDKAGRIDLVDSLIGRINRARGCTATATFDRRAAKLDGFVRVG